MPKVSAIITTFNRAKYLKISIQSVLSQSFTDFELIILDNSSTDNTEEIVKHFQDVRIRYFKHPPLNISQTRNLGVKQAQGDYIAFLDDDDEWMPTKLAIELALFDKSAEDVGLVYGGFIRIDSDGHPFYQHKPFLRGHIIKELLELKDEFTGSASNPMIKKTCITALGGFDERVKTGEDWEFYIRLTEKYSIEFVSKPLVKIRHHFGARLGDKLKDYIDLEMNIMERFSEIFDSDSQLKSFYLQRMGGKWIRLNEMHTGRKFLLDAISLNRKNWIAYLQYLLSWMPKAWYPYFHKFYLNRIRSVKI